MAAGGCQEGEEFRVAERLHLIVGRHLRAIRQAGEDADHTVKLREELLPAGRPRNGLVVCGELMHVVAESRPELNA